MRRADRLVRLLAFLRRRSSATAQALAAHLEVSERTVYRDVRDLVQSGVPIRGEAGVGYRLEKSADLPPVMLDADEVQALVFGGRLVERWADPALRAASRSALDKLATVMPPALAQRIQTTPLYAHPFARDEAAASHLGMVRGAVDARRKLSVAYEDRDGAITTRVLRPLGLWFWGQTWTLAAWCELREDYRSFRVDRLDDIVVLDDAFDDDPDMTVARFLEARRAREG